VSCWAVSSNESDDDEDETPANPVAHMGKGAAKRLRREARIEARAAEAAAKRQMIDKVVQEDSPKSSFDDDDDETVIDTPEAPVLKRKGKDISSLREREAKRQRLEANNAEGEKDDEDKNPAARDTYEEAEDEEIQAPVVRPLGASSTYHLSTLDPSAKISDIYQEWKYGQLGADPLKDVDAEIIQACSSNPEEKREYRTRRTIGMHVADAIGHGKSIMEVIENLQKNWDKCNNQNIHDLAFNLANRELYRTYGVPCPIYGGVRQSAPMRGTVTGSSGLRHRTSRPQATSAPVPNIPLYPIRTSRAVDRVAT
jgi:hypothetical protein